MTEDKAHVEIQVAADEGGNGDCVCVRFGPEGPSLQLTPQEARALASRLIQTVYQAEVKASLRKVQGNDLGPAAQRVVEGRFPGPRLARSP